MGYENFASTVPTWVALLLTVFVPLFIGFFGAPLFLWSLVILGLIVLWGLPLWLLVTAAVVLAVFNIPPLRRMLISSPILGFIKKANIMPAISDTEKVALEAGSTWIEKDLYSGSPNLRKIMEQPYNKLSGEELAFVQDKVVKLCGMVSDWDVFKSGDLPKEVWDYVKKEKFLGMIIPKEYGGLGFSAIANSEVITYISSRCMPLAVTVMVPNSLGPAELLNHYGTDAQKKFYLPRLANGEFLPCFALTEPEAGSDAGSITSSGVVFKDQDGTIKIKLNWDKRYITLAAVANVLGLAIQLRDPENILGKGENIGITCMLVHSDTPGVELGERHNPMGIPFYNCPTHGRDVIVSVDQIIGGPDYAGRGWQMLMECLAAGRAISLPAQATGGSKLVSRVTSAYAVVRKQFGISIGKFEGVEEPLARIGGLTYLLEAMRVFTVGAVDQGIKPSVVSAIAKYNGTELGRKIIIDGMDVLGGAGISRGPKNLLANTYIGTPISITVEGANILTRSMIIFGQGAIRCHPYAYAELKAIDDNDSVAFDNAFWSHIGFVVRNTCRSILMSLTRGRLASHPGGPAGRWYRKLAWASASFSILADMALGLYGGGLKFREKITGRYADVLSWMYLATATIRRFEAEGRKEEHRAFFEWSMHYSFARMQDAFDGIFANFESPLVRWLFAGPISLWSRVNRLAAEPNDKLGTSVVARMLAPGAAREALTEGIYMPTKANEQLAVYEEAFKLAHQAHEVQHKLTQAVKNKTVPKARGAKLVATALEKGIITKAEADILHKADEARINAIQVDVFKLSEFHTELLENRSRPVS